MGLLFHLYRVSKFDPFSDDDNENPVYVWNGRGWTAVTWGWNGSPPSCLYADIPTDDYPHGFVGVDGWKEAHRVGADDVTTEGDMYLVVCVDV